MFLEDVTQTQYYFNAFDVELNGRKSVKPIISHSTFSSSLALVILSSL